MNDKYITVLKFNQKWKKRSYQEQIIALVV